jgi:hypothetical protein
MAMYGIGAFYGYDVSNYFIRENIIGVGWGYCDAPELHQFIRSLKIGDVVYLKACFGGCDEIKVKAVGVIKDSVVLVDNLLHDTQIARNVIWKDTNTFLMPRPGSKKYPELSEKLNHRANTIYEEYHEYIQSIIISKL